MDNIIFYAPPECHESISKPTQTAPGAMIQHHGDSTASPAPAQGGPLSSPASAVLLPVARQSPQTPADSPRLASAATRSAETQGPGDDTDSSEDGMPFVPRRFKPSKPVDPACEGVRALLPSAIHPGPPTTPYSVGHRNFHLEGVERVAVAACSGRASPPRRILEYGRSAEKSPLNALAQKGRHDSTLCKRISKSTVSSAGPRSRRGFRHSTESRRPALPTWDVSKIVDCMYTSDHGGKMLFKVRWEDTWEPEEHLKGHADIAITEFFAEGK